MNNQISPFIVLLVINELCGGENSKPKNTGSNGVECLEGVLERLFVARSGFQFPTFADFKDKDKWLDAIEAKDIVPLYTAYTVANANTDATTFTAGTFSYETSPAAKITTYESYLGFCSHAALKSYANSGYTQVFELNNDGSIVGVNVDGGAVKGQDLQRLGVGIRQRPVPDKPATTLVTVAYKDYNQLEDNACVIKPTWGSELHGIFDVHLTQVSASATSIKFKAITDCGNRPLTSLVAGDIVVKNAAGVVQTVTFVPADGDGIYEVTGTGFANGFTVEIDGVVTIVATMYEGDEPLIVAV